MPWSRAEFSLLQGDYHRVGTMLKLNEVLRQAQQSCSHSFIFQESPSSSCGELLRRCVGCATKRRKARQAISCVLQTQCTSRVKNVLCRWFRGTAEDVGGSRAALCRQRCELRVRHRKRGEYVRLVIVDLLFQDANMWNACEQVALLPRSLVRDCKALFDCLQERIKCTPACQTSAQHLKPWLSRSRFPQQKTLHWVRS